MGDGAPADRSGIATEARNPRSMGLHGLSVRECVGLMAAEDEAVIAAVHGAGDAIAAFIEAAEPRFVRGGRLVYVGAGTSGRLGVLDASEAPPTFCVDHGRVVGVIAGGDGALRRSSEGLEDDPAGAGDALRALALCDDDTVLGIAAGGTTPYVRGALGIAKACAPGCVTGLLTCSGVEAPEGCDHLIVVETGSEVITGSTRMKAGTATKLVLNTISTTLMVRSGRVYQNLMVDLRATNDKLRDRGARIISTVTGVSRGEALALLARAGGEVKTAIVMERFGDDAGGARARLADGGGRLDLVIDP